MITFGYNNKFNGPVRAIVALALGILMIIAGDKAMNAVVKVIAIFVIASGVVSFIVGFRKKSDSTKPLMVTNAVFDLLIGVVLFIFDSFFADLFIYVIGFILLAFGVFQIIALSSANRVLGVGWFSFLMPVLVAAAGLFLLFNPVFAKAWISIMAGAALVVYGLSELISSWKMKKAIDEYEIHRVQPKPEPQEDNSVGDIKDVDYQKVD
ncbi:MAG: HdeD family acid-resistance protein [Candidatus Cryptobacteroides sp.]